VKTSAAIQAPRRFPLGRQATAAPRGQVDPGRPSSRGLALGRGAASLRHPTACKCQEQSAYQPADRYTLQLTDDSAVARRGAPGAAAHARILGPKDSVWRMNRVADLPDRQGGYSQGSREAHRTRGRKQRPKASAPRSRPPIPTAVRASHHIGTSTGQTTSRSAGQSSCPTRSMVRPTQCTATRLSNPAALR